MDMNTRLVKPGLPAAGMFHPTMIDPRTGGPICALGVTKAGLPIWPVMGGSGEDEGEGDSDEDQEDKGEEKDEEEKDEEDEEEVKDPKARIKALEEEKARHVKKRIAAESRAKDLEARLKALEEKDLTDEEKAERKKLEKDSETEKLTAETRRLRLENAFLAANTIDWVDKSDALALVDLSDVEVGEDGTVDRKSLKVALRALAKAKPHLIAKDSQRDTEDDKDTAGGATAPRMNGKGKGKSGDTTPDRDSLRKRFPALNRL